MVPRLQQRINNMIKNMFAAVIGIGMLVSSAAYAAGEYNDVPAGDVQFKNCVSYAMKKYDGGDAASPIAGQTKAQAWCECLWNETPEDFTGGLAKFSESSKGAAVNRVCEKYANWGN